MSAFIDDTNADFTDAWILRELYDQLTQLYERAVVVSRQGYWLKNKIQLITQGVSQYRVPPRAVAGGLHRIQIAYDNTLDWQDLDEVDEKQAQPYELATGQTGRVARFVMRGDTITLLPTPDGSAYALRLFYYLKPSRLIPPQANALDGSVVSVNQSTRVITLQSAPRSTDTDLTQTAMTAGTWTLDIVEGVGAASGSATVSNSAGGWHELCVVNEDAAASAAGLTFTFSNTAIDLSNVKFGDFVRASVQTEWPCLPDDFHRTLADAAAVKILMLRSMDQKASVLHASLGEDLARFGDLLKPRVQTSAKAIVAPQMYRGARRGWLVRYP